MIHPRLRRAASLLAAGSAAGALLVACGGDDRADIDYLVDARVASYNANTVQGHADGTIMALNRVLPGFSIVGPEGQIIADHDIGTVVEEPGSEQTLTYQFSKDAGYSDDKPMTCDALFLAATALSGTTPGFDAATHAGYEDIARVDCTPGAKVATVVFKRGRTYGQWREMFGAGTLLPPHVVARAAGVPNVVDAIRSGDKAVIAKIAAAWNTAFDLKPGSQVDAATFPAAGPYRVDAYSVEGGLTLVPNEKWWGEPPASESVTVWPRGTDGEKALDGSRATVVDSGDLALGARIAGEAAPSAPVNRTTIREPAPLSVTQLVFAGKGVGTDPLVRRALASCMPRDALARRFGANGVPWNLRSASPADPLGPSLNAQYSRRYPRSDVARAKSLLGERGAGRRATPTVRIGYVAKSTENAELVKMIGQTCGPAGITVEDVSSPELSIEGLGKEYDAILMSDGTFAASSTASGFPEVFAFATGDPLNLSGLRDRQVTAAIGDLAGTTSDSARLPLLRTIETAAWEQLPTIPLFGTVRARESVSVANMVPGMGSSGTGWNMDRWEVR
ncbi:ABC transporter substrate-binding protein [Gordonia sp. (in: high G+C Gram-positive bacteria)]|uniref:ABC transporter substrate-binding protein n=1 Tax=Gordonia sp. (in: high G+C Gram-positive bacteria) TaxID=84139 RepID=UPI0016BB0501|nr:ABC transporter substrate-binding protein [Gordonia sp. (in: high G+C Gram-positive bacteria)]NLG47498.1 ABC transporter substrate-binding protein [Gordonia sp. (in: high G+C Gram-positive bacteria)]